MKRILNYLMSVVFVAIALSSCNYASKTRLEFLVQTFNAELPERDADGQCTITKCEIVGNYIEISYDLDTNELEDYKVSPAMQEVTVLSSLVSEYDPNCIELLKEVKKANMGWRRIFRYPGSKEVVTVELKPEALQALDLDDKKKLFTNIVSKIAMAINESCPQLVDDSTLMTECVFENGVFRERYLVDESDFDFKEMLADAAEIVVDALVQIDGSENADLENLLDGVSGTVRDIYVGATSDVMLIINWKPVSHELISYEVR